MLEETKETAGVAIAPAVEVEPVRGAAPVSRKEIGIELTDPLAEAGRKVLGFHLNRMLRCESGTRSGEDIEALHDMRVATRRMRTACRVFERSFEKKALKPVVKGLRATGRALGQVRDMDVILAKLEQYRAALPEQDQAGLAPLVQIWQNKREKGRQRLLAHLDSEAYQEFTQNFLDFVATEGVGAAALPKSEPIPYQVRHVVPSLVYAHYEAVRAYEVGLDNASWEMLHRLRIAFKELRYTLEYFQEVLGPEGGLVVEEVKVVQDHLGELNDANVACSLLQDLLTHWDQSQADVPLAERQNPAQIATYLNTRLDERHRLTISFPEVWVRFVQPEFRRNLALAVSVL